MECKICGHKTSKFGNGTYYLEDGQNYSVPFRYCSKCNSFIRELSDKLILSHLKSASHTNINNEKRFYKERIEFLKYLYLLARKQLISISNWMDIGCSYGHLMEFLNGMDISTVGIEIDDQVRQYAQKKGLNIYRSLDDTPDSEQYDVISLVDSLYYSHDPNNLISESYHKIRPDGIIIGRYNIL